MPGDPAAPLPRPSASIQVSGHATLAGDHACVRPFLHPRVSAVELTPQRLWPCSRRVAYAYATRRRHSPYGHASQIGSSTWSWTCKTTRSRTSSASSPSESRAPLTPPRSQGTSNLTCVICYACRAKQFIDTAISQGGCVLVHCNGARHDGTAHVCSAYRSPLFTRWDQSVSCICCYVRDAASWTVMGGCVAPGTEPTVLHLAERRVFDSDQGAHIVRQLRTVR